MPRPDLTPGAVDARVTQDDLASTICQSGWSARVRPPVSVTERIKVRVMASYGLGQDLSDYELDHLVPLELGGAPEDIANLWPEPWESRGARLAPAGSGAESKDHVENELHALVCAGRMALAEAQQRIAADWRTALG